jgi:hypothetical protein
MVTDMESEDRMVLVIMASFWLCVIFVAGHFVVKYW